MPFDIQQHGFKRLLLAVSGGLDSMCLAHYFIQNKERLGIEWLGIAHVHHGLRERGADLDAELVQNFATENKVPFFRKNLDGFSLKNLDGSLEDNARRARYEALVQIVFELQGGSRRTGRDDRAVGACNESQGDPGSEPGMTATAPGMTANTPGMTKNTPGTNGIAIVTAHHAGDQAETLYMRLRRGVTLAGLSGIRPVRKAIASREDSPTIYRPFLNVTRKELLQYAKENNLTWRDDETNFNVKFHRNEIRHRYLPQLEKSVPGAVLQFSSIAAKANSAYEKILAEADKMFLPLVISKEKSFGNLQMDRPDEIANCPKVLALDTRKNRVSLTGGMDEIFRLWLDKQGFRFPLKTFKGKALLNDIRNLSYRSRFILKKRHIIWICDKNPTTSV